MNIALIGYGKMGKIIAEIAKDKGHNIALIIDSKNSDDFSAQMLKDHKIDVAIEFTRPESVLANINICFDAHIPIIVGTTAWEQEESNIKKRCMEEHQSIFTASNFSIGMNLTFELNRKLSHWMNDYPEYAIEIEEIHHTQKLDSPSGTAISLAKDSIEQLNHKRIWLNEASEDEEVVGIISKREDDVPGTHTVTFSSEIDTIEIKHSAHNRKGFASGAVIAAEWLVGKTGYFGMNDLLKF